MLNEQPEKGGPAEDTRRKSEQQEKSGTHFMEAKGERFGMK